MGLSLAQKQAMFPTSKLWVGSAMAAATASVAAAPTAAGALAGQHNRMCTVRRR
jgi:hypothetical protein